jgi:hypothetical protein
LSRGAIFSFLWREYPRHPFTHAFLCFPSLNADEFFETYPSERIASPAACMYAPNHAKRFEFGGVFQTFADCRGNG